MVFLPSAGETTERAGLQKPGLVEKTGWMLYYDDIAIFISVAIEDCDMMNRSKDLEES
jgi:hypothetical protein